MCTEQESENEFKKGPDYIRISIEEGEKKKKEYFFNRRRFHFSYDDKRV